MRYIIVLLLGLLCVSLVSAQDDGNVYGLVTINNLEVHTGPDFAYDTIAQLPLNASVIATERGGSGWLRVTYDNGAGWVFDRYVRLSVPLSDLPYTGYPLPRNRNGRVPDEFNLATAVCDQWQGSFTLEGEVTAAEGTITFTLPALQGANWYRVYVFAPGSPLRLSGGTYARFEGETNVITGEIIRLPQRSGTFTWMAAPYWTNTPTSNRQQVCPLRVGGTFDRP
jgi:hypothetical protein